MPKKKPPVRRISSLHLLRVVLIGIGIGALLYLAWAVPTMMDKTGTTGLFTT
jgi:hypothetical protein